MISSAFILIIWPVILVMMVLVVRKNARIQESIHDDVDRFDKLVQSLNAVPAETRLAALEEQFAELMLHLSLQGLILPVTLREALQKIAQFSSEHSLRGVQGFFVAISNGNDDEKIILELIHVQGALTGPLPSTIPDGTEFVIHVIVGVSASGHLIMIHHNPHNPQEALALLARFARGESEDNPAIRAAFWRSSTEEFDA